MPWKKAPADLIETFYSALPQDGRVERRKMFGYPCAFVNRNMFAGLHEHGLLVRLPEKKRTELLRHAGAAQFEPMSGRVMREYVVVPKAMQADRKALTSWVLQAFQYAAALPAKPPRKQTKAAVAASSRRASRRRRDF